MVNFTKNSYNKRTNQVETAINQMEQTVLQQLANDLKKKRSKQLRMTKEKEG